MPAIPRPLLGRHLVSVAITPQTVAANGDLSDGTTATVTTVTDNISISFSANTEEIGGANSTIDNNVVTSDGFTISLSVIEVNGGTDPDPLIGLFLNNDVFKLVMVRGTVNGSYETHTIYASRQSMDFGVQGRGKQLGTMTLQSVNAGASTIARTVGNPS